MSTVNEKMTAIADNIRSYTGGTESLTLDGMAEGVKEVYEAGITAEQIREWNIRQSNGKRVNYLYAFAGISWVDEIYEPIYPITASENASSMFNYSNITDTKVPIDLSKSIRNTANIFDNSKLVTIRKLIVSETTPGLKISSATKLENITVEGVIGKNWTITGCNALTHESLMSIINALKDFRATETIDIKTNEKYADTYWYWAGNFDYDETGHNKIHYDYEYKVKSASKAELFVFEFWLENDGIFTHPDGTIQPAALAFMWDCTIHSHPYDGDISEIKAIMVHSDGSFTFIKEPTETRTLTIGETNLAKLSDEEKAIATEKGWILA